MSWYNSALSIYNEQGEQGRLCRYFSSHGKPWYSDKPWAKPVGISPLAKRQVWLGNVPESTTWKELQDHVNQAVEEEGGSRWVLRRS